MLQGRVFAYRDTDYHRLGTSNIEHIPINQPLVDVNFNQRDGYSRYRIDVDPVHFHNNSLAQGTPAEAGPEEGGFTQYPEKVEGQITREIPSASFEDHFSQARLFWNSMSPPEKYNIIKTFIFHVARVKSKSVRQQVVDMFSNVDQDMAAQIADSVDANPQRNPVNTTASSPVLSEANTIYSPATLKVGILIGDGYDSQEVNAVMEALKQNGVFFDVISEKLGQVTGSDNTKIEVNKAFIATSPVLCDAYYVVGGNARISQNSIWILLSL